MNGTTLPHGFPDTVVDIPRIEARFRDRKGKLQKHWTTKDLYTRAVEVGLGELYESFYRMASGVHHADMSGLVTQFASGHPFMDLAPTTEGLTKALPMAHAAVIETLDNLNAVAELGLDEAVQSSRDQFGEVWASH